MSTIVTRSGKGSPLTHVEVDANFTNLDTDKVEKTAAAITGGTINGTTIGATTPAAGTFTTLESTGTGSFGTTSAQYIQAVGNATEPQILAVGSGTNIPLVLQPKGTGALQAQATTSSTVGGNARGANAVDWQTARGNANQVASASLSFLGGGGSNRTAGYGGTVVGGGSNTQSNNYGFIGGGAGNNTNSEFSSVVGGSTNSALGTYNFIGGGFTNSGTSASTVTTQSGTMNATTAVTLSGSNANIKVGQYITGTSIAGDTYVAAISGTALTLSKVASGSSTSTLSFFTPHGVVVGGGNNQATGSYSFIGGGGDAGTAANRNVASGDWSFVGGGTKNVASAIYSSVVSGATNTASGGGAFIGGGGWYGSGTQGNTCSGTSASIGAGFGNTASGTASFIGGGANNTANSSYSCISSGVWATTRSIQGNNVFSSGNPLGSSAGLSQTGLITLATQTTNATATVLTCDGSAASGTNQVILPNNSAYYFRGSVIAGVTGAGNAKAWSFEGAIERGANAASTAIIGTAIVNTIAQDAGASTWTIAVEADTTNGGLKVTVTGQASTTIRWVCKIETTEMTY